MEMSETSDPAPIGESKNVARNDRLVKMRKVNEEVLRKKLQIEARELCGNVFSDFGACAKREGLMVVINCRNENRAMSDCMDKHCNEAQFEKYLLSHGLPLPAKPEPWYAKYI